MGPFWVLSALSVFIYHGAENQKKNKKQPISEINAELTDRQTAGDFIGPSVGRGFKQSNLE